MKTVDGPGAMEQAIGRSAVYGLLARALAYPGAGLHEAVAELAPALAALPVTVGAEAMLLIESMPAPGTIEAAFAHVFTHSSSHDCPTFETAYTAKEIFQQTQQLADIAGFYRAFGVDIAPGAERLDYIGTQLEFMQLMTAKEAYAYRHLGVARVRQCRKAQRLFLRDHLGCWGPAFGRRLEELDPAGWYGRVGRLLAGWLTEECRALDAMPAEVVDAPLLAWPEPDDGECGAGDELTAALGDGCGGCPFGAEAGGMPVAATAPGFIPLPLVEK